MGFSSTTDAVAYFFGFGIPLFGLLWAAFGGYQTSKIEVEFTDVQDGQSNDMRARLVSTGGDDEKESKDAPLSQEQLDHVNTQLVRISGMIAEGADAFLFREYLYMGAFMVVFGLLVLIVLGAIRNWTTGVATCVSFLVGCITSIVSGFIGMKIAVYANSRTAVKSAVGIGHGFTTAFRAGSVMGFALCSAGIFVLMLLIQVYKALFKDAYKNNGDCVSCTVTMYECIAGYGLGGSSIAMFGRVGGGIYTKAADVGADLAGKVDQGWDEDDPRNPAVIADNVGDNVGDIAGMGADLFGSFAEATCAALVLCAQSPDLSVHYTSMSFPIMLSSGGLVACWLTSFFATHISPVRKDEDVERALKVQLLVSTIISTPIVFAVCALFLPSHFMITDKKVSNMAAAACVLMGLWSGLAIGFITEYYTSHSAEPTRQLARSCKTGAATNIIYGLALGYKSAIIPVVCLSATMFGSYALGRMFGVACGALGILMTLATGLTIDAYGPITDNAGGIAEMCEMPKRVRTVTDKLDAAGNTTAAIGKGFAIGSAALVSLALFGAFADTVDIYDLPMIGEWQFAGLVVGAMIPYWFFAMTMESVGKAAFAMVEEVRRQVNEKRAGAGVAVDYKGETEDIQEMRAKIKALLNAASEANEEKEFSSPELVNAMDALNAGIKEQLEANDDIYRSAVNAANPGGETTSKEDYAKCIKIATDASLSEMIAPGALVLLSPLIVGFLFGVHMLAGLLLGALASGVSMAISASNTGGAWDNAKKYIGSGQLYVETGEVDANGNLVLDAEGNPLTEVRGKGTSEHEAAIIGDTVGDPLKDTSGPALNIVMKLMAIVSLVFARAFPKADKGGYLVQAFNH